MELTCPLMVDRETLCPLTAGTEDTAPLLWYLNFFFLPETQNLDLFPRQHPINPNWPLPSKKRSRSHKASKG